MTSSVVPSGLQRPEACVTFLPMALIPCPTCRRHVRATDAACPFCARAGGSAALAIGLALAACGPDAPPSTPQPPEPPPPPPLTVDARPADPAPPGSPADARRFAQPPPDRDGTVQPLYGIVEPPRPRPPDRDPTVQPAYGVIDDPSPPRPR